MSTGKLEAIWIKRAKQGPMDAMSSAKLKAGRGLIGNANQGGRRQVTILEKEIWDALMQQFESDLEPHKRRANLLVTGIDLARTNGRTLRIGNARIRIYGETKPCEQMDALIPGLKEAMYPDWKGGAFGEALDDNEINVGDSVAWEE